MEVMEANISMGCQESKPIKKVDGTKDAAAALVDTTENAV